MTGRVQTTAAAKPPISRQPLVGVVVAVLAVGTVVGLVTAPYLFKGATLQSEIAEQVRATTGLALKADGSARFALWPQPHVELSNLHFADSSGTLQIDAESLDGEVRLLPLLVGRLEIASATLGHARLDIDLDGKPMPADSTIGRALRASGDTHPNGNARLGIVTLVDGTAILRSRARTSETLVTAINVTMDWRNLDAPATVTGSASFHDTPADIAAWVAQPSSLLRGDHSAIALRVQSLPFDLSANGDFGTKGRLSFHGRLSASAASVGALLALAGFPDVALPAPFANLSLASDAAIGGGSIDLPNLHLRLDGNDYEGTLSYQTSGDKPSLSGTLATEQLSLAPFLTNAPALTRPDKGSALDKAAARGRTWTTETAWTTTMLKLGASEDLDLDLRVSATHLRLPFLTVDDAALAVMTRDRRTEVALVEGKAYGGSLKGRASIGFAEAGLSLRAAGSLSDADAGALSWDGLGRQVLAGTVSASANLEAAGANVASLVQSLRGWAKSQARDGEISGIDLGQGLRDLGVGRPDTLLADLRTGRTPFQSLILNVRIADGIATVEEGSLKGQDAVVAIGGQADLGRRALDLKTSAKAPRGIGEPVGPELRLGIGGTLDNPMLVPDVTAIQPGKLPDKMP